MPKKRGTDFYPRGPSQFSAGIGIHETEAQMKFFKRNEKENEK
jgi:hypothetical protein